MLTGTLAQHLLLMNPKPYQRAVLSFGSRILHEVAPRLKCCMLLGAPSWFCGASPHALTPEPDDAIVPSILPSRNTDVFPGVLQALFPRSSGQTDFQVNTDGKWWFSSPPRPRPLLSLVQGGPSHKHTPDSMAEEDLSYVAVDIRLCLLFLAKLNSQLPPALQILLLSFVPRTSSYAAVR